MAAESVTFGHIIEPGKEIYDSIKGKWPNWSAFYYVTCGLALITAAICVVAYLINPILGRGVVKGD